MTLILLKAGGVFYVLLMLHNLSLNFSLFLSKYMPLHLFAWLFGVGNASLLDSARFFVLCNLIWNRREEEAMCFAMGTCFLVPKLITGLMKTTIQVYWRVVDGLWDSNVFCVGTSVVREWLGEGEKHTL